MTSTFQLRADEAMFFQGDVSSIKSLISVDQGGGTVTNQRCLFQWGSQAFSAEKHELAGVREHKYGLGTKLVVQHTNGQSVTVSAANMKGLKNALYALAGLQSETQALKQPERSAVKNTTAWMAAFGPLWADLIVLVIGSIMGWNWEEATTWQLTKIVVFKLVLVYSFMRIDHLFLQQQGFNTSALGMAAPENFPVYLFSRAKAFGQGKGYAITWCVLMVLEVLFLVM
jgi:hypothetical protein